jgi:hypothetical protein
MFLLLERIAACSIDNHYLLRRGRRIGLDPLGSEVVSCWMFECGGWKKSEKIGHSRLDFPLSIALFLGIPHIHLPSPSLFYSTRSVTAILKFTRKLKNSYQLNLKTVILKINWILPWVGTYKWSILKTNWLVNLENISLCPSNVPNRHLQFSISYLTDIRNITIFLSLTVHAAQLNLSLTVRAAQLFLSLTVRATQLNLKITVKSFF